MIKKFNQYNESLLKFLKGPTEDETLEKYKDKPEELLKISVKRGFINGIIKALQEGANVNNLYYRFNNEYLDIDDDEDEYMG